jgi:sulfite reductase (NADPH) flavoprotein alpha-component
MKVFAEMNTLMWAAGGTAAYFAVHWYTSAPKLPSSGPTGFDDYLKKQIDNPCDQVASTNTNSSLQPVATSFEAYLRKPISNQDQSLEPSFTTTSTPSGPPPDSIPIPILFGTEYGFSKEVSEKLCDHLTSSSYQDQKQYYPVLLDMADYPEGLSSLTEFQALLVVCSTQGDGVPPGDAREFCDWLGSSAAPPLGELCFSVAALGDRSYTHFARCGKTLDARLEALGAGRLAPRVDVNKEDWAAINGWISSVVASLNQLPLKTAAQLDWPVEGDCEEDGKTKKKKWNRGRPYPAKVIAVESLCTLTDKDDKNTVRVELDLGDSELTYLPGDALGVWPKNNPAVVDDLLSLLGVDATTTANEKVLVQVPSWHYEDDLAPKGGTMPLRRALEYCYDLKTPRPELFSFLKGQIMKMTNNDNGMNAATGVSAGKKGHRGGDSVTELSSPPSPPSSTTNGCENGCVIDKLETLNELLTDPTKLEAYLEPRHITDILRSFSPAKPTLGDLPSILRPLQPRLYSISSSIKEHPTRVQATIALVKYESLGEERVGVASTQLGEHVGPGDVVSVYISKNPDFRLPADDSKPIIMVGPGTGLAPFRSFMMERLLTISSNDDGDSHNKDMKQKSLGEAVLFFGCRRRDQDYLYGDRLEEWAAEKKLTLFTAFSREKDGAKVYVQNKLREAGDLVWELLDTKGGHFYVCGDAAHMAGDVEKALLEIIEKKQGGGLEGAKQYLEALSNSDRYQRDVWF